MAGFGLVVAISIWAWTQPRNQPVGASKIVQSARDLGAKAREAISEAPARLSSQPHQDVYNLVCAKMLEFIKTASTAKFSVLGKDVEAVVEPLGRNVYRVRGFVDAQNLFGAVVRDKWSLSFQMDGGKIGKVYSYSDDEGTIGNPEDATRVANGLPTLAEEKERAAKSAEAQLQRDKLAATARMRIECHRVARERISSEWSMPSTAKFSTLQAENDQWTTCREIEGEKLWVATGVVDPKGQGINRLNWKSVCAVYGDSVVVRFSQLGNRTLGDLTFAKYAK